MLKKESKQKINSVSNWKKLEKICKNHKKKFKLILNKLEKKKKSQLMEHQQEVRH